MKFQDKKYILKVKGFKRKYLQDTDFADYESFSTPRGKVIINNTNNKSKASIYSYNELYDMSYNLETNRLQYFDAVDVDTGEVYKLTQKVINKRKLFVDYNNQGFGYLNNKIKIFKKSINGFYFKSKKEIYTKGSISYKLITLKWKERVPGRVISKLNK